MDPLISAISLQSRGQYLAALNALEQAGAAHSDTAEYHSLRSELLEVTGDHSTAHDLASRTRKSTRLTANQRARCENVLGRILVEDGHTDEGAELLQRALALATKVGDLRLACGIQCKLLSVVSERSGPDAATPLLAELRRATTKLGLPHATAQLHLLIAEMEATRGAVETAIRHVRIGQQLLVEHPQ